MLVAPRRRANSPKATRSGTREWMHRAAYPSSANQVAYRSTSDPSQDARIRSTVDGFTKYVSNMDNLLSTDGWEGSLLLGEPRYVAEISRGCQGPSSGPGAWPHNSGG